MTGPLGAAAAVLGPGGALERVVPGYEHRAEQLTLAGRVEAALQQKRFLIAEAGTGTGKTLAYLVPALQSGRRVVVSTATKTLQEQIFFKDIELVARALGRPVRAAYMKGRNNYLCKLRWAEWSRQPSFAFRNEATHAAALREWAEATETGDRSELLLPEPLHVFRDVSVTSESSLGQKCPKHDECFVTKMRREAAAAELVIVNHHLFCADLALRTRGDGASGSYEAEVIPRYDAVIFDEAHALEEAATQHFGVEVSSHRLDELCRDARKAAPKAGGLGPALLDRTARLEERAAGFFHEAFARLGLVDRGGGEGGGGAVRLEGDGIDAALLERNALEDALGDLRETANLAGEGEEEPEPEVAALARRCAELRTDLGFVCEPDPSRAFVHFAERRGRGAYLRAAPVEAGPELFARLRRTVDTAIFTSATLAVAGSFWFARSRLGLARVKDGPEIEELAVGSPFDYRTQAALYLPAEMPEPAQPSFLPAAAKEIEALVTLFGGRAFVLTTSVRALSYLHDALAAKLPFQVLRQGELPKAELLLRFRERPSVLFATASFWEGVDVPGDALSLVILDKLPFASPGDPLIAARVDALKARGLDAFATFQVPSAAISLRQGFGRLVRTRQDRGVVALLDPRIRTKGYGRRLLQALPDCPRLHSLEEVAAFAATLTAPA